MPGNKQRRDRRLTYTWPMPTCPQPSLPDPGRTAPPLVRTVDGRRTLEFSPGDIQSEMLLARPDALVLAYARAMMTFAWFVPDPRHIVMVGLGGGSLVKFCYRHFPASRITVIELRADVIALRDQFHLPPDDRRLRVLHADAARQVGLLRASADVLLIDGFDQHGLPAALGSAAFYADCRAALRPGGVLAANIFSYDPARPAMLARLRRVFAGRLCWFDGMAGNNQIVFALKPGPGPAAQRAARRCARAGAGRGLGARWINWLLARLLVAWLARRGVPR
jgi:spermidine synthase